MKIKRGPADHGLVADVINGYLAERPALEQAGHGVRYGFLRLDYAQIFFFAVFRHAIPLHFLQQNLHAAPRGAMLSHCLHCH
jgi:hypothetical protein